jgi:protein-disulfide isomerase/uncharacterized membrane protein
MRKLLPLFLVVAAGIGLYFALHLVGLHFDVRYDPAAAAASPCEMGETLSCGTVNGSRWSEVPLGKGRAGLPTAVPAVGFFAMSFVLGLFALFGADDKRRGAAAIVFPFAAFGLLLGLYLIYIQAFVLKAWCLYCLGVDAASLALVLLSWFTHGGGFGALIDDLKKADRRLAGLALILLLAVTGGSYGSYNGKVKQAGGLEERSLVARSDHLDGASQGSDEAHGGGPVAADDHAGHDHAAGQEKSWEEMSPEERRVAIAETQAAIEELYGAWQAQEVHEIGELSPFDLSKGNPEAKVRLVEWADFQCPMCRQAAFFMQDVAQRYYDHVQFAFRHYPLGQACNEAMSRDMHPDACEAAVGVQCAQRQGKGWDFHDHTFDSSDHLGTRRLMKISDTLGLDRERFEACLESTGAWDEVRTQVAQGAAVGIFGTPSFFVNGRELASVHPVAIEAILRWELREAGVPVEELPDNPDGIFPF